MKVAYIFRNNMASTFQLATMILPQLETNTHLVNVLGMFFFDDNINILRQNDPVGERLAKIAKEKGFQNIFTAEGNVSNLKEIILQNFDPKNGNLIYVSGELVSYDLDKELKLEGYYVKRIINYSVSSNEKLSDEFVGQLKNSIPEIVFIYSENSARSYLNLLKKYNLIDNWMDTNLMCLGEKSSAVLNEIKWKKIFLFNPGEEEYLLYKI